MKENLSLPFQNEDSIYQALKKDMSLADGSLRYAGTLLQRAYERFSSYTALIGAERTLTYKELYLRAVAFSTFLHSKGIKRGERVFLISENSVSFYVAYFAIWQAGAIVVPLNTFLHEKELSYIINDAQPVAIIVSPGLQAKVDAVCNNNQDLVVPLVLSTAQIDYQTPLDTLERDAVGFVVPELKPDEMCLLLYTSGTTGVPKGVMLSTKNIITNTLQANARLNTFSNEPERYFCVLPLFHVFAQNACIWVPVMTGGTVIIVSSIDRKLILEGLAQKPTLFFGVPALYGLLCLMKNAPVDSVKMFVSGADALPDKIRAAFAMLYGRKICAGYGLTEASPVVAVNTQNDELATHCVGKPMVALSCQIRDEDGSVLPYGRIGELWIKGDNIMLGYYKGDDNTRKVFKDGWLNTGDLACFDARGNLSICGRSKDLIIHKGFNIYPQEVENVLMKHPSVFKVAVVGLQEENSGQIPVAYVATKEAKTNDMEDQLRTFCAAHLASYKIPRKFICADDLPMNATGKVDKKKLQSPLM